jgi:hypothetical protein
VCVWLPACRCGVRLARYLKHPRPGSVDASKLVVSLEPGSHRPGSCSRATEGNQPNRRIVCRPAPSGTVVLLQCGMVLLPTTIVALPFVRGLLSRTCAVLCITRIWTDTYCTLSLLKKSVLPATWAAATIRSGRASGQRGKRWCVVHGTLSRRQRGVSQAVTCRPSFGAFLFLKIK